MRAACETWWILNDNTRDHSKPGVRTIHNLSANLPDEMADAERAVLTAVRSAVRMLDPTRRAL